MAGSPFGVSGFNLDPLSLLAAKAMPQQAAPATDGGVPPSAPVAPAAPSPVPGTGPSGGGATGEPQSMFGGIGTALSNAISGAGLFGTSAGDMGEANPLTGMTPGMERRGNMQSMMKMGLLLMAAGARQSDDSRARILGSLPAALGDKDDVNAFARNRLEMAKVRLMEKEQLNNEQAFQSMMKYYGGAPAVPAATPEPGAVTPIGTPMPTAADVAPGGAAVPPIAAPAVAPGGDPAAVAAPGAPGAAPLPPGAPPAGVPVDPAELTPQFIAGLPTSPPPAPKTPEWQPGEADWLVAKMNRNNPLKAVEHFEAQRKAMREQQIQGPMYIKPGVGVVADIYKGGRKVDTQFIREVPENVVTKPGPDNTTVVEKRTADGRTTDHRVIRDDIYDAEQKDVVKSVSETSQGLAKQYNEVVKPAISSYRKAVELEDIVKSGNTIHGNLGKVQRAAIGWAASLGMLGSNRADYLQSLVNTDKIQAELGSEAGKFAKENYGPQVSDQDRQNAQLLMGALETNQPEQIAAAVERIRAEQKRKIESYNGATRDFHGSLDSTKLHNKDFYKGRAKIADDIKFDEEMPWERRAREAAANPAPAQPAAPATPTPGKIDFDPADPKTYLPAIATGRKLVAAGHDKADIKSRLLNAGVPPEALKDF